VAQDSAFVPELDSARDPSVRPLALWLARTACGKTHAYLDAFVAAGIFWQQIRLDVLLQRT